MGILAYYCWFWRTTETYAPFTNWVWDTRIADLETNEGWLR